MTVISLNAGFTFVGVHYLVVEHLVRLSRDHHVALSTTSQKGFVFFHCQLVEFLVFNGLRVDAGGAIFASTKADILLVEFLIWTAVEGLRGAEILDFEAFDSGFLVHLQRSNALLQFGINVIE